MSVPFFTTQPPASANLINTLIAFAKKMVAHARNAPSRIMEYLVPCTALNVNADFRKHINIWLQWQRVVFGLIFVVIFRLIKLLYMWILKVSFISGFYQSAKLTMQINSFLYLMLFSTIVATLTPKSLFNCNLVILVGWKLWS